MSRTTKAACSAVYFKMASVGTEIISLSQAKIQQVGSASVKLARKVLKDPVAVCFQLMHLELTWISDSLLVPFVAEPSPYKNKVALLFSSKGLRKISTLILHCIVIMRGLLLLRLLTEGKLQVIYKGNLTVDVCFAAANIFLVTTMGYAWVRIWLNLDYFAWVHNTINEFGSGFARRHLNAPNPFVSNHCNQLIRLGLTCLITSSVILPFTGLVGIFVYSDSVLFLGNFIREVMEPNDFVLTIGELIDMLWLVTLTIGNVFLSSSLFNFGASFVLILKELITSSKMSWRRKLGYYTQLAIILRSVNAVLGGLIPCIFLALFMLVMAYNAILFNFVSRMENPFLCCISAVSSIFGTFFGFSILQFAETIQILSDSVVKDIQSAIAKNCLKKHLSQPTVGKIGSKKHMGATLHARRFLQQPLAIGIGPFGTINTGDSVIWMEQIIENTVTAIFTVSIGSRRWLW